MLKLLGLLDKHLSLAKALCVSSGCLGMQYHLEINSYRCQDLRLGGLIES